MVSQWTGAQAHYYEQARHKPTDWSLKALDAVERSIQLLPAGSRNSRTAARLAGERDALLAVMPRCSVKDDPHHRLAVDSRREATLVGRLVKVNRDDDGKDIPAFVEYTKRVDRVALSYVDTEDTRNVASDKGIPTRLVVKNNRSAIERVRVPVPKVAIVYAAAGSDTVMHPNQATMTIKPWTLHGLRVKE